MKPRLTVVVPVPCGEAPARNVEECLASVAAQTLTALDVVLVEGAEDDGEAGAAAEVVREYAERDPRFRAGAGEVLHTDGVHGRPPEGAARYRRPGAAAVRERFAAVAGIRRFLADPAHPERHAFRQEYDRWALADGLLDLVAALPSAA